MAGTPKIDGFLEEIPLKWMIGGYPHFRKPPHRGILFGIVSKGEMSPTMVLGTEANHDSWHLSLHGNS